MKQKTISDSYAKGMCIRYLQELGYEQVQLAGRDKGFDLTAYKETKKYFFEVKYSSKKTGKFFGTVMLTELYKAVQLDEYYYFLVCRGNEKDPISDWFFKLIPAKEFMKNCTLTTPIFHYHLYLHPNGEVEREINFSTNTVKANQELIFEMWHTFQKWKKQK